jgi:hypothetical protein
MSKSKPESVLLAAMQLANEGKGDESFDMITALVTKIANQITEMFRNTLAPEDATVAVVALTFLARSMEAELNEYERELIKYIEENSAFFSY